MIARLMLIGIGVSVVVVLCAVIYLQPGSEPAPAPPAAPIGAAEHDETIEAMRPTKRKRPVIAILANNEATEITHLLVPYGVLRRADVADVIVVARSEGPIGLFPLSRFGSGPETLRDSIRSSRQRGIQLARRSPAKAAPRSHPRVVDVPPETAGSLTSLAVSDADPNSVGVFDRPRAGAPARCLALAAHDHRRRALLGVLRFSLATAPCT